MTETSKSRLTRPIHPMPPFVKKALADRTLMDAYHSRPAYQQNDYIGWITRAKMEVTKLKRLNQMLDELEGGKLYMNMRYSSRKK